jgi:hypothetical protein
MDQEPLVSPDCVDNPVFTPSNNDKSHPPNQVEYHMASKSEKRYLDALPTEILEIILLYLTSSFRELIRFCGLSKECQNIANHSLLWFNYSSWTFRISKNCLRRWLSYNIDITGVPTSNLPSILGDLIYNPFNDCATTVELFSDFRSAPLRSAVEISVSTPSCWNNDDDLRLSTVTALVGCASPEELAYKIRIWFMSLFVEYHRVCYWHANWSPFIRKRVLPFCTFVENHLLKFICLSIVLLFICLFLLSSINDPLSISNNVGFAFLLVNTGLYCFLFLCCLIDQFASTLIDTRRYLNAKIQFLTYSSRLCGLVACLGVFLVVLLSYLKLSSTWVLDWTVIAGIFWIFMFVASLCMWLGITPSLANYKDALVAILAVLLFHTIPLSAYLVALYFENSFSNLGVALIPVFPILAILLFSCFLLSWNNFSRTCYYAQVDYGHARRTAKRVVVSLLSLILLVLPFLMLYSMIILLAGCFEYDDNDANPIDTQIVGSHFPPFNVFLFLVILLQGFIVCFKLLEPSFFSGVAR